MGLPYEDGPKFSGEDNMGIGHAIFSEWFLR